MGEQTFTVKGSILGLLAFASCTVFVATAQICYCSEKTIMANISTNGYVCIPMKFCDCCSRIYL